MTSREKIHVTPSRVQTRPFFPSVTVFEVDQINIQRVLLGCTGTPMGLVLDLIWSTGKEARSHLPADAPCDLVFTLIVSAGGEAGNLEDEGSRQMDEVRSHPFGGKRPQPP